MKEAFTLVELLVVITIIVVLLAMLSPALDRAMGAASSAVCLSNLHQWGVAMRHYASQYKGARMHVVVGSTRANWWTRLGPYVGEQNLGTRVPLGTVKMMVCPNAPIRLGVGIPIPGTRSVNAVDQTVYVQGGDSFWGSASSAWQRANNSASGIQGSYGWNYWTAETPGWNYPPEKFFGRFNNTPGDAVLLGDAIWIGSWPQFRSPPTEDSPPLDTENGNASTGNWFPGGELGRWVINRHPLANQSVNIGFADGTARNVRLGELWALQWHKTVERSRDYMEEYP